jgi:hypothetical protein
MYHKIDNNFLRYQVIEQKDFVALYTVSKPLQDMGHVTIPWQE